MANSKRSSGLSNQQLAEDIGAKTRI